MAILAFMMISSAVPLVAPVQAQEGESVFSVTLVAPSSNPIRRQYAAIISQSMQQTGIDAKLVYVTFSALIDRLFTSDEGKPFAQGGFDISFIGWGQTSPITEFKAQFTSEEGDLPPTGNNYYLYDNPEVNELSSDYARAIDPDEQVRVLKRLQAILYRDMPDLPIYYFAGIAAMAPEIRAWGQSNFYRAVTFPDLQHWSGITELNMAEVGDVDNINPLATSESNSFYALYIYGSIVDSPQFIDARDFTYKLSAAESITSTPDGLTWTVTLRPGVRFHDGVEVTADDAAYTYWLLLNPVVASVNYGFLLDKIGSRVSFTFLNGTTTVVDNTAEGDTPTEGSVEVLDKYTYQVTLRDVYFAAKDLVVGNVGGAGLEPKHLLEQIAPDQINSHPFATMRSTYTYTWDTSKYGGSGSYTASGPIGAGPYIFESYDFTARLATLRRNNDYWNATGLQALGQFTVETYRVAVIVEKEAAIASYSNREVNLLDPNYSLANDIARLEDLGAQVARYDDLGWQEMGFNMKHPIVGTGVDTPLGKQDPGRAAEAARHVRKAISYLIPRQLIIDRLLNGQATAGVTFIGPYAGGRWDSTLKSDPYDPEAAKRELAAAGYGQVPGEVNPIEVTPITITPPPVKPAIVSPELREVIPELKEVKLDADFLYGSAVTLSGRFANPVTDEPYADFLLIVQVSTNRLTWEDVSLAVTDEDGNYNVAVVPPEPGTVYYRAFFTGYTVPAGEFGTVQTLGEAKDLIAQGLLPQVLPPATSPVTTVRTAALADLVSILASGESIKELVRLAETANSNIKELADTTSENSETLAQTIESLGQTTDQNVKSLRDASEATTRSLSDLSNQMATKEDMSRSQTQTNSQITTLQNQVATLTNGVYAAIALAIILGVVAIALAVRKRAG